MIDFVSQRQVSRQPLSIIKNTLKKKNEKFHTLSILSLFFRSIFLSTLQAWHPGQDVFIPFMYLYLDILIYKNFCRHYCTIFIENCQLKLHKSFNTGFYPSLAGKHNTPPTHIDLASHPSLGGLGRKTKLTCWGLSPI